MTAISLTGAIIYIYIYIYIHIYTYFMCMCVCVCVLGMCIFITEADAIRISMHSQRYNTLKIYMKQLAMPYDSPLLRCSAIRFDSTQCDLMQYDAMEKI